MKVLLMKSTHELFFFGTFNNTVKSKTHQIYQDPFFPGWESQILETGFLATFLCPVWNLRPVPEDTPTSKIVIWGFRWLIFRIMIGAVSLFYSQTWSGLKVYFIHVHIVNHDWDCKYTVMYITVNHIVRIHRFSIHYTAFNCWKQQRWVNHYWGIKSIL